MSVGKDTNDDLADIMHCKCGVCDHVSRTDCIRGQCYCCDLEDAFALLTRFEFEPQSKIVTNERRNNIFA